MKITNFKEYAKKAKRTILAKTALLVGLTVPLASCGKPVDKETNKLPETKKIVAIDDTNSTEILEGATIEEVEVTTNEKGDSVKITEAKTEDGDTIKITETTNEKGETVKVTEQTNEKGETVKITEKTNENGETVKITEKKDENGEVIEHIETATVEKTTGGKTNIVTTSKITTNKTTTTKAKGKTTVQTTRVTTKPVVTAVKTQPVQTQPKQTQPIQTQPKQTQPIVTQPPVTEPPKPVIVNYTKNDLFSNDADTAAAAYEQLANEMWNELYNNCAVNMNGKFTNGYPECQLMIAVLNYGQGINTAAIADASNLGSFSIEKMVESSKFLNFAQIEEITGGRIDFNKYTVNSDLANFLNKANNAWLNYKNGNTAEFDNISVNYFNNIDLEDPNCFNSPASYIKLNYMVLAENTLRASASQEDIDAAQELYEENVINPLFDSYQQYIGRSYKR